MTKRTHSPVFHRVAVLGLIIVSAALFLGTGSAARAEQNLLTNGSFETGNFNGWTVVNSGLSYVTSTSTFVNYYEPHNQIQVVPQNGKYMAVMNGSLSQTVLNKPGKTYRFTGWFFTIGPAAYYFYLNNSNIFQFSTYSGSGRPSPWLQIAFDFKGSGSDTFTIAANPSGNSIVDNFSIVAVTPTFAGTPGNCILDSGNCILDLGNPR